MKISKKITICVCLVVLCLTAMTGWWFRSSQKVVDGLEIQIAGESRIISLGLLKQNEFDGELVNGKGEHSVHHYEGIELSRLLADFGVDLSAVNYIELTSADQYSVTVTGDELREEGRVYIVVTDNGKIIEGIDKGTDGIQLIVFGDADSKRCVRYLKQIKVF